MADRSMTRDVLLQIISQFESKGMDEAKKGLLDLSKMDKPTFLGGLAGIFKGMASNVLGLLNPLKLVRGLLGTVGGAVNQLGGIFKIGLGVVAGTAISTITSALAQLAQAPVMVAARVETLETVLWRIGQQAGFAQDQLQGFVEGLKETGITTQQALNNLMRMIQANLDLSKATDLARVAQDAAVIAGTNSSEAFERLLHGITTLQPEVLRGLGIVVDMQTEIKKWADANGVAATAISATTKQQIAFDAVLRAGQTIAGSYESAMTQVGKKIGSLPRYIEEAQLALGRGLTPILSAAVDATGDLMKKLTTYFESIQPALTEFSERVGVGLTALYEKGQAAVGALIEGFSRVRPYLQEVGDILGYYLPQVGERLRQLWFALKDALAGLSSAVSAYVPNMASLWTFFTDLIQTRLQDVISILDVFRLLLKGKTQEAGQVMVEVMANQLALLIILWEDYVSQALTWGYNLVAEFANGMISAASQWITTAVDYVGSLIAQFLAAFSAPEKGVLSGIVEWGQSLINTYLKGFALADFSILDQVGSMIYNALEQAVSLGDLAEDQLIPLFDQVQELTAGLIANFRETGQISEEMLGQIAETLGEGSEALIEYLRLQLEYEKALEDLAAVQEEYAEAEAAGFIPQELKDKLAAAEEATDLKAEELAWQEAYLQAQQDSVDLQVKQVQVMQQLAAALEQVATALGKGKAGKDPWAEFVQQYEEDMAVLEEKRRLGLISEEDYLKELGKLYERYVEQAIRMGKPYDEQLAALQQLRDKTPEIFEDAPPITFPVDTTQLEEDIEAGIADAFAGVSERFTEARGKGKELLANLIEGAQEALANLPDLVREKITEAWDTLREQYPIIDEAIGKAQMFAATVLTVFTLAKDTILSAVDVITGTSFPHLRSAFDTLTQTMAQFGISWSDVWNALAQAAGIVAIVIGATLMALVAIVVGVINGIATALDLGLQGWQIFMSGIQGLIDGFSIVIAGWANLIIGIFTLDLARAWDGLVQIWTGGVAALEGAITAFIGFIGAGLGIIGGLILGFVEGVVSWFQNMKDRLVGASIIPDLVNGILTWIQRLYTQALAKIVSLVNQVVTKITELKNQVIQAIADMVADVLASLEEFRDRADEIMTQVRDWIQEKINAIVDAFNSVKDAISNTLKKLKDFLSELADAALPDWLTPGSATPFELGLRGIAEAMRELPELTGDWTRTLSVQATSVPVVPSMMGQGTTIYLMVDRFEFPSIRTARDAGDFWAEIQAQTEKAKAKAAVPGGV